MNDEQSFHQAMQHHPEDNSLRLVFADWLEERGDKRGELIRLLHTLTQSIEVPDRKLLEERLRSLLASGVQPVGPFWTNSIGMKFAWIPAGSFVMSSPQHQGGFFLAIHPVTQTSWQQVMGNNPSQFHGDTLPVEQVSWDSCQEFLRVLSVRDGRSYRLPTGEEWEYACRAGTTTPFYFGERISTDLANYDGRSFGSYGFVPSVIRLLKWQKYRGRTTPVGSFPPNAFGLYDMHGNVWEWCNSWATGDTYWGGQ